MASPQYSILYSAKIDGAAANGSAGDVLLPDATSGLYVLSTTAARGTRRSTGIAAVAYHPGDSIEIFQFGQIDAATAGLGAGTDSFVRVNAGGHLERCTPAVGDEVVGWVEAGGVLHCFFGLYPGFGAGGVVAPGAPDNAVQYRINATTFGGAANVAIAGGDLCVGVGLGAVATTGSVRSSLNWTWYQRDTTTASDRFVMGSSYYGAATPANGGGSYLLIGSDAAGTEATMPDSTFVWGKYFVNWGCGPFPYVTQAVLIRDDVGPRALSGLHVFPMLLLGRTNGTVDPGRGDFRIGILNGFEQTVRNAADTTDLTIQGSVNDGTDGPVWCIGSPPGGTATPGNFGSATQSYNRVRVYGITNVGIGAGSKTETFRVATDGNVGLVGYQAATFGGGKGVWFLGNANTNPSANPTSGVIFYVDAGDGFAKYRKADGTIIKIDNAAAAVSVTGTGFWKSIGGVLQAAASKVDTTDSTYVTVPATANGVVRVASSALANSANFTEDGSGNATLASSLAIGTTPATSGDLRLKDGGAIKARNAANNADLVLMKCLTNLLVLGADDALANYASITRVWSSTATQLGNNSDGYGIDLSSGQVDLALNGQVVRAGGPIIGRATNSSPYSGCNAEVVVADPAGGTTTLTASQYATTFIQVANSITTGTHTGSGGNVDFPTPAAGNGYPMLVYNGTNGSVTCRKAGGGGGTVVIGIGKSAWVWVMNGGVYRMTADA